MNCIDQVVTDSYTAINGDCVDALKGLPDHCIGYSIFSPPFASLYTYSNSPRDMGNVRDDAEFFEHFDYLIAELRRVMKPGRNVLPLHGHAGQQGARRAHRSEGLPG
jgi:DNA modification methylase